MRRCERCPSSRGDTFGVGDLFHVRRAVGLEEDFDDARFEFIERGVLFVKAGEDMLGRVGGQDERGCTSVFFVRVRRGAQVALVDVRRQFGVDVHRDFRFGTFGDLLFLVEAREEVCDDVGHVLEIAHWVVGDVERVVRLHVLDGFVRPGGGVDPGGVHGVRFGFAATSRLGGIGFGRGRVGGVDPRVEHFGIFVGLRLETIGQASSGTDSDDFAVPAMPYDLHRHEYGGARAIAYRREALIQDFELCVGGREGGALGGGRVWRKGGRRGV